MNFKNFRISVRLGAGFGILMLLMLLVILVGVIRLSAISAANNKIIEQDWVSAAAITTIDAAAREDARRTLALFILKDRDQRAKSYERIDLDKKTIDAALVTLHELISTAEGNALLEKIQASRAAYFVSFLEVADLIEEGRPEAAADLMNSKTFPALDTLLENIRALVDLQKQQVIDAGAQAQHDIESSRALMIGLGLAALIVGIAFAAWATRSITAPLEEAVGIAKRVADGDLASMIEVTSRDETGQLLQALKDMTHSLAAQESLRRAVEAAEDATKMKSDFLANMSHEIRTPMNGIIGMTHLALQTELTTKQRNYLEKVDAAAKNLLGIINDILDFSKIEAGKLDFEHTDFYLEDVMEQVADLSVVKAQDKGLELLFDIAPDVPTGLVGDSLRLGQVIINLTNNAIKFTEKGEITIAIRKLAVDGGQVRLRFEVRDTGVGLTEVQRAKLFNAFTQADTSTTRKYGGTGLGLTICKRLVEMMDGSIGVDSEAGVGSTFYFDAQFGLQTEQQPVAATDDVLGLRILVVDDNASAREIFLSMLSSFKCSASAVGSGAEALAALQQAQREGKPYGLVLMDWQMQGMNGIEAIKRIRANDKLSKTPAFVMVTAYSRDELLEQAQDVQIDGLLTKPVSPSTLLDSILSAFGKEIVRRPRKQQRHADYQEAEKAVGGAYLLLVDDNQVNQELAQEILEDAGIRIDIANNGAEALQKIAQADYDGVLMDCQMPVMDGYTATRKLREDARFASLPVIAMTANAMVSDREKCLAAGMNDFIAKPIAVDQLFTTLARWIKPRAAVVASAPAAAQDDSLPRIPGLDINGALQRVGGNAARLSKLLRRFNETQADAMLRIQAAIDNRDMDTATREAHTLKGLAGNIGAAALSEQARVVERMLKHGESADVPAALEALEQELASLLQRMTAALGPAGADAAPPVTTIQVDKDELAAELRQLAALLADDDSQAVKRLDSVVDKLAALGQSDAAKLLKRLVSQYDFDAAAGKLRETAQALDIAL